MKDRASLRRYENSCICWLAHAPEGAAVVQVSKSGGCRTNGLAELNYHFGMQ